MLQNYLQSAIGIAGRAAVHIGTISIPYTVIFAVLCLVTAGVAARKFFNKTRLIGVVVVFALWVFGLQTSDYYFNHEFYDLQYNWHFIAYGIFSYLAYRRFKERSISPVKIILYTFFIALAISSFDEIVQVFISNRVFDMSDIAKDMWGCIIGQVFVQVLLLNAINFKVYQIRLSRVKSYLKHPFVLLVHQAILAYIFLYISSLLSDARYWGEVIVFTVFFYFVVFYVIHIGKTKIIRWIIRAIILLIFIWIASAVLSPKKHVTILSDHVVVYNGIPIYYFDVLIYSDGRFRLVDKKDFFKGRDKLKLDDFDTDIVLLGTGSKGDGGLGYNAQLVTEMRYSIHRGEVYQIIKLKNKEAVERYNKLTRDGKKVVFIIHNN
jgi:VanZ family protein